MPDRTDAAEVSKPGHDYVEPDLPDGSVDSTVKHVLELYAREVREHASGIIGIIGISPVATNTYKQYLFEAADLLDKAARILKQNARMVQTVPVIKADDKSRAGLLGMIKRMLTSMVMTIGSGEMFFSFWR